MGERYAEAREQRLRNMEAIREHAPTATSVPEIAKTLKISEYRVYELLRRMPDGRELLATIAKNRASARPAPVLVRQEDPGDVILLGEPRSAHPLDGHPLVRQLRLRRLALGLTTTQVASELHWHAQRIRRYENGVTAPGIESAAAWAAALGLELMLIKAAAPEPEALWGV